MAWDDFVNDPLGFLTSQPDRQMIDLENKQAIQQPLTPEEQETLLQKMLGSGASALSFAGSTLNKLFGGRAIRAGLSGLTGGDMPWRELLSVIPGSDVVGLTDETQAVTGRKLLDQWGVAPENKEEGFFSPENLAGIGLDIATDPATFLLGPGAALTGAGKAAAKLGIVPKTTAARIAGFKTAEEAAAKLGFKTGAEAAKYATDYGVNLPDLIGKPLGGLGGWRVPFTGDEGLRTVFGTGPKAQRTAELIGAPFDWLRNTKPAAYAAAQFNPMFEGVVDPRIQNEIAERAPFTARRTEALQRGLAEAYQPIIDLGEQVGGHNELARAALEGTPLPTPWAPEVHAAYETAAARANALKNEYADLFRKSGGNLGEWESIFDTGHAFRAPTPLDVTSPVWSGSGRRENVMRQMYSGVGPAIQREAMFDIPGGTNAVERLVQNPLISSTERTIGPAGRDITWLSSDPRRSAVVEQKLSNVLGGFTPADQQAYTILKDRAASGIQLTPAEQQTMDTLRRQYWAARRGAVATVRSDVLGGYNPRALSALEKLSQTRPLTPAELEQLDNLYQLKRASDTAAGRITRLAAGRVPLPGQYADAASAILPELKGTLQDQAAEAYLRSAKGLNLDPQRLADLQTKSGLTPQDLNKLVAADPAERKLILQQLQTPGTTGGNAAAAAGQILTNDEAWELLQESHLDRIAGPLAQKLGSFDPRRLQIGLFGNDPFADLLNYGRQMVRGTGRAEIANKLLASHAIPLGPADTGAYGATSGMTVGTMLDQLRLNTPASAELIGQGMKERGLFGTGVKGLPGDVAAAGLPPEIAESLMQLKARGSLPEYAAGLLRPFDAATQLTRASITAPWPGFHVRNLTTDLINAMQAGGPQSLRWNSVASALARGEAPEILLELPMIKAAGITDARIAADLINREAFATGGFGRSMGKLGGDVLTQDENSILRAIPGVVPQPTFMDIMSGKTLPETSWKLNPLSRESWNKWSLNPLRIQGLMGQTETGFAPAAWGRSISELEDAYARGGMFLHGLSQGYAPTAAANLAGQTIYHGAQFTPFEQQVMRRLVPFWGYTKYVVPQQLRFLAERPGGLAAQGIRLSDSARSQGFLPEYMSNTLAIPIGQETDGTQRYLSRIDMPWEALFNYLQPGRNANAAVYNTSMNLLSQLNPLIKGVAEGATNKQFMTGRDLDDLYGGFTGVASLDNLLYNSPASRVASSGRTLADPRKYTSISSALGVPLNLLTGAKVTDIEMEKQRSMAQLQALREYLKHDPNITQHVNFAPTPGKELSAEEVQMLQLMRLLNSQNQAAARQKAAAGR